MERWKRCGNCANFMSERDFLPLGFCSAKKGQRAREDDEACVGWERDFRGIGPGGSDSGAEAQEKDEG